MTKEQIRQNLIKTIAEMGYPEEFGLVIANSLGSEKQMTRMAYYLTKFQPSSAEEIADEMLAIQAEFERYKDKAIAEHYNSKYNELLNSGPLDED